MVIKKIALILISLSSLVQASNNDMRDLLIGTTALAVATTGSILAWRHLTHGQDEAVIGKIDHALNGVIHYKDANDDVKNKALVDLEVKVVTVCDRITPSKDLTSIKSIIDKDLKTVKSLRSETLESWDFWMRSWFNPDFNSCVNRIDERKTEVENVRLFLVEANVDYFSGWQSATEGRELVEKIYPNSLDSASLQVDSDVLYNTVCNPTVFGNVVRPLYACNKELSNKLEAIEYKTSKGYGDRFSSAYSLFSAPRNPISMYKNLTLELRNIQTSLSLLSVAIQRMSKYKQEHEEEVALEEKREAKRKEQAEARRIEEAHQATLQAARAQEIAAQAQVRQAQAAERQAKAQQQEADTNLKRLSVEERNAAIKRRAQDKSITEAQAQKELELEDAWNYLAGVAIVGLVGAFSGK